MSYKVVYFSKSGNSKRVAEKIAKELSTEVMKISDGIDWNGAGGIFRSIFYSIINKDIKVEVNGEIKSDDEVILVAPIWAGKIALPAKKFLSKISKEKVHLVTLSGSSIISDSSEFKSITGITAKSDEDDLIKDLTSKLM